MSAGQTGPFFSNIKSWEFLTFFYCVADVAKCLIFFCCFFTYYTICSKTVISNLLTFGHICSSGQNNDNCPPFVYA